MRTIASPAEPSVVIHNVSWETYEALLRDRGDHGPRMSYDRGTLEIMSPTPRHESLKKLLARLIEAYSEERGIDIRSTGSTTYKRKEEERGLEPDESYYVQNEARVRGKIDIELGSDPPPDLAIEVDHRHSSLAKLGIYAALGIGEVWLYDGELLTVHLRDESGTFTTVERSAAFPDLELAELPKFLARLERESETRIVRDFRSWVRNEN